MEKETMGTVGGAEGTPLLATNEEKAAQEERQELAGGWTADGLPLGHGSVVGEPVARSQWNSSLFACLGRHDEFCSSDLEVCLLGSFAPCMLYGSNVERIGEVLVHLQTIACHTLGGTDHLREPEVRGSCEAFTRSCGCCQGMIEDGEQRENCESACDFATHFFCHACSLCQEGRELRRRLPHPGFNSRSLLVMIPPMEQTMGRGL